MELHVIGSSSAGNCYVLKGKNESLIIEAGLPYKKVQPIIDFNPARVAGLLLTHEHGDHAKYVGQFLKAGIQVVTSNGTASKIEKSHNVVTIKERQRFYRMGFEAMAFNTEHDCAEPLGFIIKHAEAGTILFLTDTHFSKYAFPDVDHFIIEANYSSKILNDRINKGLINAKVGDRVFTSHMEIGTTIELLKASRTENTKTITLIHLSDKNSDAFVFKNVVQFATGVSKVEVAEAGKVIQLNKNIF